MIALHLVATTLRLVAHPIGEARILVVERAGSE
jgi:hypothetical protein